MKTIHLEGIIKDDEDGVTLDGKWQSIAEMIGEKITSDISSKHEEDSYETETSLYVPKVFFRFYVSDDKCTLEEAVKGHLEELFGALDIYTTWYGYSEYTIEGYNVENFTVGNHDLEQILKGYIGKYIHILVDVQD